MLLFSSAPTSAPGPVLYYILLLSLCLSLIECRLVYTIPEQLEPGSLVGHVASDAKLRENYVPPPSSADLQFAILPGKHRQWFSVDAKFGTLRTSTVPIDRDTLCADVPICVISVEVAVIQPVESFHVFPVDINIRDINDNAPTFTVERYSVSILENAVPGQVLYRLPPARDIDAGVLSVQKYVLLPGTSSNETFELRTMTSEDGTLVPNLSLKQALDREMVPTYTLRLFAFDGGNPPRSATLYVDVKVMDVNDNDPVFVRPAYNITVREDIEAFTTAAQVQATDRDVGLNGRITYHLSLQTKDTHGDLFAVNNITGDVYLLRKFDSLYRDVYNLVITATDHGVEPRTAMTRMTVHVHDVNSHPPSLTVNDVSQQNKKPEVAEGQPTGAFVAYVSVSDPDRGVNGEVVCTVTSTSFALQLVHRNTYVLTTLTTLDREQVSEVTVVIKCSDKGVPSLTSTETVTVTVLDQNDNAPRFLQNLYEASVRENNEVGRRLLTVAASDLDIDKNAEIVYSLVERGRRKYLRIDPVSGVVSANMAFDYEETPTYQLEVVATDKGVEPLSSTALITIHVLNENDCAPIFTEQSFSFGIFENLPEQSDVGTVSAMDLDGAPFNEFNFRLESMAHEPFFAIDPQSGKISARVMLDRESAAVYYIKVIAVDVNNASLTSSASVTIYVADKNDNAPIITFPADVNQTIEVSTYSPKNYIVAKIQAHDADIGTNAKLTYSMSVSGGVSDRRGLFDIDPHNGAIYLVDSLRDYEPRTVVVQVLVTDQGSPALFMSATLSIRLNDSASFAAELSLFPPPGPTGGGLSRSLDVGTHQKIIIVLGSVTMTLVVLLIAAIIFVKRCRADRAKEEPEREEAVYMDRDAVFSSPGLSTSVEGQGRQCESDLLHDEGCYGKNTSRYINETDDNNCSCYKKEELVRLNNDNSSNNMRAPSPWTLTSQTSHITLVVCIV